MDGQAPSLWETLLEASGLPEKAFYETGEVAKILGVSRSTLARWRRGGLLRSTIFGPRRVAYLQTDLRQWVEEMERST